MAAVWYGNDDYTSMNKMTGGMLPAMTWHDIMAYAHQGIETKPPFGVPDGRHSAATVAANQAGGVANARAADRPNVLSRRSAGIILDIGSSLRAARPPRPAAAAGLGVAAEAAIPPVHAIGGRLGAQ